MSVKLPFIISLIILVLVTPIVLAFSDQPINVSDEELQKILEKDEPDEIPTSYWELPLWIKIHYIVTVVVSLLTAWKLLPVVITKIKSALENVKRRKILKIVLENPGVSLTELEEITEENRSTLRYHLNKLEREGWIKTVKHGKNRLIFLDTHNINPIIFFRGRKREIIELLKENGGMTPEQIAEKLDLNVKTVHYYLNVLRRADVLVKGSDGKYRLRWSWLKWA